jgi:hypothetical protein
MDNLETKVREKKDYFTEPPTTPEERYKSLEEERIYFQNACKYTLYASGAGFLLSGSPVFLATAAFSVYGLNQANNERLKNLEYYRKDKTKENSLKED